MAHQAFYIEKLELGVLRVTFMNRGMQNKRQRITSLVIIGIVLATFLVSIVAYAIS